MKTVAILGAGSWGTAVAIHIAKAGHPVYLWGRNQAQMQDMRVSRKNSRYLPESFFPESLIPTDNLIEAITAADEVLIAVPSHAFAELLSTLPKPLARIAWLTKGLDANSNALLSELIQQNWGNKTALCYIAGPSFAHELARSLPTAISLVSNDERLQSTWVEILHHHHLRPYRASDLIGAQLAGAVKNVMAIACGISDGLGFGANARAALITRGLSEMRRLGLKMGAEEETFAGLPGLGDLVLTCTDNQSRNRRFGLLLGEGKTLEEAKECIGQVVEGIFNTRQICELSKQHQVEMPICTQIHAILMQETGAKAATQNLMTRPLHEE